MVSPTLIRQANRAAMYVRMSTEHQQYSTENQADAILKYADRHHLSIVKKFVDYGKSGLRLSGRVALCELLKEVESGAAEFETILVYDVSRWGRYQDADESAYYEYVCKRAGVFVHYCAEEFRNDGSLSSTLLKAIKRSMAAEYSRELSVKVFAGQSRLVEMGYRQGGAPGFGLRRQLVDREGKIKGILNPGERKSIQTDRVVLIPLPDDEVAIVRVIFDLYTESQMPATGITRLLNEQGVLTDQGRQWTRIGVHQLLTNPKYIGTNLYNRKSYKLNRKTITNPNSMWVRRDGAFEAIVPLAQFIKAQQIAEAKCIHRSDEEMLECLRRLWARAGKLSADLINEDKETPCADAFKNHFKALTHAYSLIGYEPNRKDTYGREKYRIRQRHRELFFAIKDKLRSYGAIVEDHGPKASILINGQFTASVVLCYCCHTRERGQHWSIRLTPSLPDVTIAARLKPGNMEIQDYYLFPNLDRLAKRLFLTKENQCRIDVYRFESLDFFLSLGRRCNLVENA